MSQGPYRSEVVHDDDFERLVAAISRRPGMYVGSEKDEFAAVHAYISGYNAAKAGGPLMGFQEWLVLRNNGGNNIHWPGTHRQDLKLTHPEASDAQLVAFFGEIITAFLAFRKENGLTVIFRNYATWLSKQTWYDGPLRKRRKT